MAMEEKRINRIRLLILLLLALNFLICVGCPAVVLVGGGAAAGGGAVAYIKGELKSTAQVSLDRAWKATQMAMDDLEFTVTGKEKDVFDAELTASGAGDKKIKVALKKISDTRTEIKIRVGAFGDKSLSQRILETIKKRL
jgi:hypothetical protein